MQFCARKPNRRGSQIRWSSGSALATVALPISGSPWRTKRSCILEGVKSSRKLGRYTIAARLYDVVSFERPVYRPGRLAGIESLRLQPGDRVLDLGCGTGLNFPVLRQSVGPTGTVVGVDSSEQMLARAQSRVQRHGWENVRVVEADAADCRPGTMFGDTVGEPIDEQPFDAVLATFSLSIIGDGQAAWHCAMAATRPGGRIAVVDLALPRGRWAALAPLARFACFTGGVDLNRRPWQWVARDLDDIDERTLRGGHIRVGAGSVPDTAREAPPDTTSNAAPGPTTAQR